MIVLTAIAGFFKRIWEWIKQTAWIQPLLIVGVIFGVIFSIPSIVNAIKSAQQSASEIENYYHKYQLSLEGGETSEADVKTKVLYKGQEESGNLSEDTLKEIKDAFGTDKFFLTYVADTCPNCVEAKGGFDYLENNWNKSGFEISDNKEFKLVSIFTDEVTTETSSLKSAFVQYMDRYNHFFELAAEAAYNTDYYELKNLNDSDIEALGEAHPDNFLTPTILLIDFSETAPQQGVSEVMFGVNGDSDKDKAELLLHCWNHTDEFSVDD